MTCFESFQSRIREELVDNRNVLAVDVFTLLPCDTQKLLSAIDEAIRARKQRKQREFSPLRKSEGLLKIFSPGV